MPLEVTTCIWYQLKGKNLKFSFLDISMTTTCTLMHKSVTMATKLYKFEPNQKLTFFITEKYMQLLLTFVYRQTVLDINSHHLTSTIFLQHFARCHGNHAIYDYWVIMFLMSIKFIIIHSMVDILKRYFTTVTTD